MFFSPGEVPKGFPLPDGGGRELLQAARQEERHLAERCRRLRRREARVLLQPRVLHGRGGRLP